MKDVYYNDKKINSLIQKELDIFFKDYDGTIYAYLIMNKKNPAQIRIINNSPAWFDIYMKRNYQFVDPVIIRALRSVDDFYWENSIISSGFYNLTRIFNESLKYDIYQGRTFPLHDYQNNLAVLSIVNHKDSGVDMEKDRSRFTIFFIQLHQKVLNLYSQSHQKENVFLSPRERQVLKWVSTGKTYDEVSVILSISERTVKFHMGNVMKKLGVNNSRHAVKLGTELRLLEN